MIALTAVGLCSSLGTAVQACAAVRAGLDRRGPLGPETPDVEGADPVEPSGHPCSEAAGFEDFGRLTMLLRAALLDAFGEDRSVFGPRTGLVLALPHLPERPALYEIDGLAGMLPRGPAAYLLDRVGKLTGLPLAQIEATEVLGGHAAVFDAISRVVPQLERQQLDRVVLCAVDSLVEPRNVERFAAQRRLSSGASGAGFFPAEGAAVLVLESMEAATARGASPLVTLGPASYRPSPWTDIDDEDEQGERFSGSEAFEALREVLQANRHGDGALGAVLNDCNGEAPRANHLWTNILRFGSDYSRLRNAPHWSIAECFGDLGAATGAFQICVAARAFAREYAGGEELLLCATSDRGDAGAAIMCRPEGTTH